MEKTKETNNVGTEHPYKIRQASADAIFSQLPYTKELVDAMLNGHFGETLIGLRDRRIALLCMLGEYEDFNDYKDEVKRMVALYEGFSVVEMTKEFTITLKVQRAPTVKFFSPKWFAPFSHIVTLQVKDNGIIDAVFEEEDRYLPDIKIDR